MKNIDLDSRRVYEILLDKKLKFFYHANTVKTALTFIDSNAVLSREYVENHELNQTKQSSDDIDKKFGIWNYIFLDAKDLAEYYSQPNVYGPVLFAFDNKLLLDNRIPTIRITKINPCYWTPNHKEEDFYFSNLEDFNKSYLTGNKLRDAGIMFILTTLDGKLEFKDYLLGFKIDSPSINTRNKNGQTLDYSDAIINKIKSKLEPKFAEKLTFKKRKNKYFITVYHSAFENRIEDFERLFNP